MISSEEIVLIAGDGRSGTTLLSVILDSNPALAVGPELHFRGPSNLGSYLLPLLDIRQKGSEEDWEALRTDSELRNGFHFINRVERFGLSPASLEKLVRKHIAVLDADQDFAARAILVNEIGVLKKQQQEATRWGMKIMRELPLFQKYLECWPNATFIHIIRDGRDVLASQMVDHASWGYGSAAEAAEGWTKMMRVAQSIPSDKIIEVRYEDLVADTEAFTRQLCDRMNVDWSPAMLCHHVGCADFMQRSLTHPSAAGVSQPVNASSIGRYKRDLTDKQIREFEVVARDWLIHHGYYCEC